MAGIRQWWPGIPAAAVLSCVLAAGSTDGAFAQADTVQTNVPALRSVYAHDFTIGCLLSYRNIGFATDPPVPGQSAVVTPQGGYLIKFHMNRMSPGNNMKPQYTLDIATSASAYAAAATQSARDSIDVHPVVRFNGDMIAQLNWAQRQGFTFRGHTLVWHNQTPTEFFRSGYTTTGTRLAKAVMIQRMDFYFHEIFRLIHQSWSGLLAAFDIVNEAIDDNTGAVRTTGNEWYTTFGDTTYIMTAFQLARQYTALFGETQIKLYYNDYNTETPSKADGIVRLLTPIYQAGDLDGIGMQEHNNLSTPTAQSFITSYNKFSPICTEMSVTELDVATGSATPSAALLASQANQYGMLFKCFTDRSAGSGRGKIVNVSKDGLNDQYTFQTGQASSLWDANMQCKPAFYAVARIGLSYFAIDSLIALADTLSPSAYTSGSWGRLAAAVAAADTALARNYSVTVSADTALALARGTLQGAIDSLVRVQTGVMAVPGSAPSSFALAQNYPNPFNPATVIGYTVATGTRVTLKVYSLLGAEVATLVDAILPAGKYTATFDGHALSSGVYVCRLSAGTFTAARGMLLVK
ncbi:MAG TPA: endo-1,4-beta-xylanase [Bacteroidota bacterium]|nr:endo-1,4-beta-xylanase [Bacteroidota bacterium]